MSVKIISSNEMEECTCGVITDRKMVWIFFGDEIHKSIPFCHSCEKDLKWSIKIQKD